MIKNNRSAFTLAEMMIVMLILTILLAAFAPLMTKKSKVDLSNPWRWANNNSDIYYGMGNTQTAMIGQNNKAATDPNAKLLINQTGANPAISFIYTDVRVNPLTGTPRTNLLIRNGNLSFGSAQAQIGGQDNTTFGIGAISSGSNTGSDNVAVGNNALNANTTGEYNVAIGFDSARRSTTGNYNTAVGGRAGSRISTGHDNTAVGYAAGGAGDGDPNPGSWNTSLGAYSLLGNTTGDRNTAIGYEALKNNTTGANNIAIGVGSCQNVTTGSNKICIGNYSGPTTSDTYRNTSDKIIYLGDSNTTVYIPGHLVVDKYAILGKTGQKYQTMIRLAHGHLDGTADYWLTGLSEHSSTSISDAGQNFYRRMNTTQQDVEQTPFVYHAGVSYYDPNDFPAVPGLIDSGYSAQTGLQNFEYFKNLYPSDRRLKENIKDNNTGLDKIRQLKVFNYTFKKDKKKTPRVGVIAQDLQKILPDAVTKGDDGFLMIRMEDMFYASINAIKELDKMLQDLVAQVKTIATQVKEHDTQIKAIQKENKELKAKVQNLEKRLDAIEKKL